MTRKDQVALYAAAFRASHKVDFQRRRAVLASMMDRFTRADDFDGLIARLQAKSDAAWATAKAATLDHDVILEACQVA